MIYTRGEIVELVRKEPEELQPILIALIWSASHCDPNLITDDTRFGLTQLHVRHANQLGFSAHPNQLLDVPLNIRMASEILQEVGLIEFLGREMANQFHAIVALARELQKPSVAI